MMDFLFVNKQNAGMNGIEVFSLGTLDWERTLVMLPWWMWQGNWAMI